MPEPGRSDPPGAADASRPSAYQIAILRAAGCRVRPRSWQSARQRIDRLAPSDAQAALLAELGLPVPATREAASAALTAYELEHPEWAQARRAARTARGRATREAARSEGAQPRYNETLQAWHAAGRERFGGSAASLDALSFLRALALRLPQDGEARLETFRAMRGGLSAREAAHRIDALRGPPGGPPGEPPPAA
ncbi:hypothetical protein FHS01_001901 [Longimicrobium terrae]|uniref:hypothetical protein n=1 Tax=Longimicrobium terrae TaxID=1639882 RepID=UPI00160A9EAF|nr:hypothetical protein [Longimicrobium terrae]MBB4635885.1 hypothetical protein [Longimicrobium terrae]